MQLFKSMKCKLVLTVLALYATMVNYTMAQDTIKVGINDQLIQVSTPKENQKVSIIIEDSTSNYKVDISRYSPSANTSFKSDIMSKVKQKKNWSSRFFGEVECGFSGLALRQYLRSGSVYEADTTGNPFIDTTFIRGPVGNYNQETFSSNGTFWGFYLDLTVREKVRSLWKTDNIYLSNGSHLRFIQNFAKGNLRYREMYGYTDFRPDSTVSEDLLDATLSMTNLQFSKRYTIGTYLNKSKDFSIEYGWDVGIRINLARRLMYGNTVTTGVSTSIPPYYGESNFVSTTFFTFNHRLGINFKRFSANVGLSFGDQRIGSYGDQFVQGKRLTAGVAYRW